MKHAAALLTFNAVFPLFLLAACGPRAQERAALHVRGATMGAGYEVQVVAPPPGLDAARLRSEVERQLAEVDRRFSTYRADSELSQLNAAAGGIWIPAAPELVAVLAAGQEISRRSGGAFDMTVKPLVDLWGFGGLPGGERVPGSTEIAATRAYVGMHSFEWRRAPPSVRKTHTQVRFDVNGIVPGHAADRVAGRLDALGVRNYRVDLGGEMRLRGQNAKGRPWLIAIEKPLPERGEPAWVIEPGDGAVSTSGDYRNYFEVSGRRYSHMMDPRGGHPVRHAFASVTVVAASALAADAWSTALLVLGPDAGPARAREQGVAALFVSRAGETFEVQATPGFPAVKERRGTP